MSIFIGNKIYQARIKAGKTQKQLADAIEISEITICKYEKGALKPNINSLSLIAKELGVSIDSLYFGNGLHDLIARELEQDLSEQIMCGLIVSIATKILLKAPESNELYINPMCFVGYSFIQLLKNYDNKNENYNNASMYFTLEVQKYIRQFQKYYDTEIKDNVEKYETQKEYIITKSKNRITSLRKQNNLSQLDLAIKCKLKEKAIINYENRKSTPSLDNYARIAVALNTSLDYLYMGDIDNIYVKRQDGLPYSFQIIHLLTTLFDKKLFFYKPDSKIIYISKNVTNFSNFVIKIMNFKELFENNYGLQFIINNFNTQREELKKILMG